MTHGSLTLLFLLSLVASSCKTTQKKTEASAAGSGSMELVAQATACDVCEANFSSPTNSGDGGSSTSADPMFLNQPPSTATTASRCPLPSGCVLLGNTSIDLAERLQCFKNAPASVVAEATCNLVWTCPLAKDKIDAVKAKCCSPENNAEQKLICLTQEIDTSIFINEDKKCKEHSSCLKQAAVQCGLSDTYFEVGWIPGGGHAWVETLIDSDGDGTPDQVIVSDAQNTINYRCPYTP